MRYLKKKSLGGEGMHLSFRGLFGLLGGWLVGLFLKNKVSCVALFILKLDL